MPLITVVMILIVVGILLYLLNHYVPIIDPTIKQIINCIVIIVVVIWLIGLFLPGSWYNFTVGRPR